MDSSALYILPPLIGAVIGGVTNHVAIKMLFRPYQPMYLLRWRIPLTPGLIPQKRAEIAQGIAGTFVKHVLQELDLKALLLTENNEKKIKAKIDGLLDKVGDLLSINPLMLVAAKSMATDALLKALVEKEHGIDIDADKLGDLIVQRINELPINELESLVLGFSKDQFRHITFFGVLLGALIGGLQVLLFGTA